jgi:hypothetical protein
MLIRLKPNFIRAGQILLIVTIGFACFFLVAQLTGGVRSVHALPEYSNRTGEPCGTCHVNPGGGGPRTLSGLLWAAKGRPDEVPTLPGVLAAPAEIIDGLELYDIACAGCHGLRGEGLFAINIARSGISRAAIRSFVLNGIPELDMPAFEGKFTETQLNNLLDFSAQLSSGEISIPVSYELDPAQFACDPVNDKRSCGEK